MSNPPAWRLKEGRGELLVLDPLPFAAQRLFVISRVPPFTKRGEHAHRTCAQVISCAAGSFHVMLRYADGKMTGMSLDAASVDASAIHVPPMTWVDVCHFTPDAVCVVAASASYDPSDMITDYETFLKETRQQREANE